MRHQAVVLEDHRDLFPAKVGQRLIAHAGDVFSVNGDLPGRRFDQADEAPDHGRLAAAGQAHDHEGLAGLHLEVDVLKGNHEPQLIKDVSFVLVGMLRQQRPFRPVAKDFPHRLDADGGRFAGVGGTWRLRGRAGRFLRRGAGIRLGRLCVRHLVSLARHRPAGRATSTRNTQSHRARGAPKPKGLARPLLASLSRAWRYPNHIGQFRQIERGLPGPPGQRPPYRNFSSRHLTASRGPSSSKRRFHSAAARPE